MPGAPLWPSVNWCYLSTVGGGAYAGVLTARPLAALALVALVTEWLTEVKHILNSPRSNIVRYTKPHDDTIQQKHTRTRWCHTTKRPLLFQLTSFPPYPHHSPQVLHMGNYMLRQWQCPHGESCESINKNAAWGDTIIGWYHEFLAPFKVLLDAAPWVMSRGSQEICMRAGLGWNFLFSPDDFAGFGLKPTREIDWMPNTGLQPSTLKDGEDPAVSKKMCPLHHSTFTIGWANGLVLGVMDTSGIREVAQSVGRVFFLMDGLLRVRLKILTLFLRDGNPRASNITILCPKSPP